MSDTFTQALVQNVQRAILKKLSEGTWLEIPYGSRIKVDMGMIEQAYRSVDMARVTELVKSKIEEKLADKIFNALATEIATDVKSIMSNMELREQCRGILREHMKTTAKNIRG